MVTSQSALSPLESLFSSKDSSSKLLKPSRPCVLCVKSTLRTSHACSLLIYRSILYYNNTKLGSKVRNPPLGPACWSNLKLWCAISSLLLIVEIFKTCCTIIVSIDKSFMTSSCWPLCFVFFFVGIGFIHVHCH